MNIWNRGATGRASWRSQIKRWAVAEKCSHVEAFSLPRTVRQAGKESSGGADDRTAGSYAITQGPENRGNGLLMTRCQLLG